MHSFSGGRKVYVLRYRLHHGFAGCALAVLGGALVALYGALALPLLLVGVTLAWHDRCDWRQWIPNRERG